MGTSVARLRSVVLEAADPMRLANFYRDLTGMPIVEVQEDWVTLQHPNGGTQLCVQLAPGHKTADLAG